MSRARNTLPHAVAAVLVASAAALCVPAEGAAQSLRGSVRSLDRQNRMAVQHDYTFLRSTRQVRRFVDAGYLVPVRSSESLLLSGVSFPYARPEVRLFLERLSRQYRSACGERLVVTSLTRPRSRQPGNASTRSVHPTGMAVDLRRSGRARCRRWLEDTLIHLERQKVAEATRERRPPHYHVAIFSQPYTQYVERITGAPARLASADDDGPAARASAAGATERYRVRRGDSLWTIARRHATSVSRLRALNDLRGSRIYAGQTLVVPASTRAAR